MVRISLSSIILYCWYFFASFRLTAAVVNVFSGIVNFYAGLSFYTYSSFNDNLLRMKMILQRCSFFHSFAEEEPDMEFIDMSVINGGLTYILAKQSKTGEFPVTGPIHNYELLVSRLILCTESCADAMSSLVPNARHLSGSAFCRD